MISANVANVFNLGIVFVVTILYILIFGNALTVFLKNKKKRGPYFVFAICFMLILKSTLLAIRYFKLNEGDLFLLPFPVIDLIFTLVVAATLFFNWGKINFILRLICPFTFVLYFISGAFNNYIFQFLGAFSAIFVVYLLSLELLIRDLGRIR